MKKYGLNELREMFLAFFEEKGHLRLDSFSLIPQGDPSLLLINSGMAPMKTWFTGEQTPPRNRVCTCQKCIRTGDIENVGKTSRHGTYFEMLGNFSFGDYFKREAIAWSWEFLTDRLGMDASLLYPSVYTEDDESYDIWHKEVGIPAERIARLGKDDNFWDHGSGPCGPCSEIYFDRGAENGCGSPDCAPGCDCDRFVEIWNNVFTQFNNDGNNNYTELAQKNIDTGMGLERLAVVCQGVNSLFEVDTIMGITNRVSEITGVRYGMDAGRDMSLRVITDHIRSATMMICDGVLPSNEGRGYVLRRLLRRASRHGRLLGTQSAFLGEVCKTVIEMNKNAYPDLLEKQDFIIRVINVEEENFGKTIDAGSTMLGSLIEYYVKTGRDTFSGEDAFRLYDTYGFPIDLTLEILEERGLTVDIAQFDALMLEQRMRARAARAALGDLAWASVDLGLDSTPTAFTGYDKYSDTGKILACVVGDATVGDIGAGDEAAIVLDRTPFYAERGGQCADHGTITSGNAVFNVTDVQQNKAGKYLHHGVVISGAFSVGGEVDAKIDVPRREAVMRAHSATHLLQQALRLVLGDHVNQAGSLVEPDRLRFDFTHFSALTGDEMAELERIVNGAILSGYEITVREMQINDARAEGATALFGEKYGDEVRVVKMGTFSIELCGGTHLSNTAKAGPFAITSEFSVASGVRRIEATTGKLTLGSMTQARDRLTRIAAALRVTEPGELVTRIEQNQTMMRDLRSKLEAFASKESGSEAAQFLVGAKNVGGLKLVTAALRDMDIEKLRQMGDALRDREPSIVAVLASVADEKITFLAICGKDAVSRGVRAGDIIKTVSKAAGGSGGGKPESAMGGGKDPSKVDDALALVDDLVAEILNK